MRRSVRGLDGAQLDAAVRLAVGADKFYRDIFGAWCRKGEARPFRPSRDWSQGGPLIERGRIDFEYCPDDEPPAFYAYLHDWGCHIPGYKNGYAETARASGPTPLVAAMRAYCTSVFGDEVELPD